MHGSTQGDLLRPLTLDSRVTVPFGCDARGRDRALETFSPPTQRGCKLEADEAPSQLALAGGEY